MESTAFINTASYRQSNIIKDNFLVIKIDLKEAQTFKYFL